VAFLWRYAPLLVDKMLGSGAAGRCESRDHHRMGTNAVKDMRRLVARDRERIIDKMEQYARNPASMANQVITLTGGEYMRLRVGDYRVMCHLHHRAQ
jgi:mRNA-degrading endonuclease RelE of RelBE toxin-antitoxin system